MSNKLEPTTCQPVTSCVEDPPAKTLAPPEREQDLTEPDPGYGQNTRASFASFDPDSLSWRTSQRSVFGGWVEFSETWPRAGMMQSGTAYRLPPSVPLTAVIGSFWLPTPTVADSKNVAGKSQLRRVTLHLSPMAAHNLWPKFQSPHGGPLNPNWVEWLMGFPVGWTALDVSGMP